MQSDLLHVVTVISNPQRWKSRIRLYRQFCEQMLDSRVKLTTVECALGKRPFELADVGLNEVNWVGVRHQTVCWHKESLINIGISRMPPTAQYIAWIDADVTFRNPTWAADTVHALQQFRVIQPWVNAYDLGPKGEHLDVNTSFASLYQRGDPIVLARHRFPDRKPPYKPYHSGYAWAARREWLTEVGGLYEDACLGSADHNMAFAMMGRVMETVPADISPQYMASMLAWQARAVKATAGRIGAIGGTIEHAFHGAKSKRGYTSRVNILRQYHYDPLTDIRRNLDGVIELTGNKPDFQRAIERYFHSRDEDANTI